MISDIKRDIPKFGTVFTQTRATYGEIRKQNSNFHKGLELWAKSINDFRNFERHFPCATSAKILAAMYARVPQAMAQFVLKIEKLSHIIRRALTVSVPDYDSCAKLIFLLEVFRYKRIKMYLAKSADKRTFQFSLYFYY